MAGISDIFEIGRLGLQANQKGISVASHNISNASTEGFSRQEVVLEAARPLGGVIPAGVKVGEVRRNVDRFIEAQLTATGQDFGQVEARYALLQQVEAVFTETDTFGINNSLDRLFNAFRDLSNFPVGGSQRTLVLTEAAAFVDMINLTANSLNRIRQDIDSAIGRNLTTINGLATQIASLNEEIQLIEASGKPANDLQDKRRVLLNELAGLISIETVEMNNGITINVGGQLLVSGNTANSLVQVIDADNPPMHDVALQRSDGTTFAITSNITGGEVKGQLSVRDSDILGYMDRLDRLAAVVVNEINQQHQAGYGLDGTTGNLLFSALSPESPVASERNSGGAVGTSTSILTPAALTMDTYQITFTNPTTFDVINVTDGTAVLSGQTYSSGGNIDFEGLRVVLTDGAGAPAAGDVFTVSAHKGAAADLTVALTDPDKIAASSTAAGVPGDNVNALSLVAIQTATQSTLGSFTLNEYQSITLANVGSDTEQASLSKGAKQAELDQITALREGVSGVSLDEELTHLLTFQRSFEASARLITVADELFQTVLGLGL